MNRRQFLASASAAAVVVALPAASAPKAFPVGAHLVVGGQTGTFFRLDAESLMRWWMGVLEAEGLPVGRASFDMAVEHFDGLITLRLSPVRPSDYDCGEPATAQSEAVIDRDHSQDGAYLRSILI